MKGLVPALVLFCFIAVSEVNAQLLVGPVVGGAVSKATFFDKVDKDNYNAYPIPGFDAGGMASMRVKKNFVLNVQLLYAQRGKIYRGTNDVRSDSQFRLTSRMKYIEMPIFYVLEFKQATKNFNSGKGGQRKVYDWFAGGGPVISYWLSNQGTLKSSYLLENGIDKLSYKTVFGKEDGSFDATNDANVQSITEPNRFQFAINISGGVAFQPVGFQKIIVTGHLNIGQTFFSRTTNGYFPASFVDPDAMRVKNHTFRISAAYLFDTKIENLRKGKSTKDRENKRRR